MKRTLAFLVFLVLLSTFPAFADEYIEYEYDQPITFIVVWENGVTLRDIKKNELEPESIARYGTKLEVIGENDYWYFFKQSDGSVAITYKTNIAAEDSDLYQSVLSNVKQQSGGKIPITNEMARFLGVCLKNSYVYKSVDANGKGEDPIGVLHEGDTVYVKQVAKYWYRIVFEGYLLGYVLNERVRLIEPNIPSSEGEVRLIKVPEGSFAYLRSAPDSESKALQKYTSESPWECVRVLDVSNGWAHVLYGAHAEEGYIWNEWLSTTKLFD